MLKMINTIGVIGRFTGLEEMKRYRYFVNEVSIASESQDERSKGEWYGNSSLARDNDDTEINVSDTIVISIIVTIIVFREYGKFESHCVIRLLTAEKV